MSYHQEQNTVFMPSSLISIKTLQSTNIVTLREVQKDEVSHPRSFKKYHVHFEHRAVWPQCYPEPRTSITESFQVEASISRISTSFLRVALRGDNYVRVNKRFQVDFIQSIQRISKLGTKLLSVLRLYSSFTCLTKTLDHVTACCIR